MEMGDVLSQHKSVVTTSSGLRIFTRFSIRDHSDSFISSLWAIKGIESSNNNTELFHTIEEIKLL